jgi:hypothetical protein
MFRMIQLIKLGLVCTVRKPIPFLGGAFYSTVLPLFILSERELLTQESVQESNCQHAMNHELGHSSLAACYEHQHASSPPDGVLSRLY